MKDDIIHYSHSTVADVQPLYNSEVHSINTDENETENIKDDGHSSSIED